MSTSDPQYPLPFPDFDRMMDHLHAFEVVAENAQLSEEQLIQLRFAVDRFHGTVERRVKEQGIDADSDL